MLNVINCLEYNQERKAMLTRNTNDKHLVETRFGSVQLSMALVDEGGDRDSWL